MPIYEYKCRICGVQDQRFAGFDDDIAACHLCPGLMLRLSDPFAVSQEEKEDTPHERPVSSVSH